MASSQIFVGHIYPRTGVNKEAGRIHIRVSRQHCALCRNAQSNHLTTTRDRRTDLLRCARVGGGGGGWRCVSLVPNM